MDSKKIVGGGGKSERSRRNKEKAPYYAVRVGRKGRMKKTRTSKRPVGGGRRENEIVGKAGKKTGKAVT